MSRQKKIIDDFDLLSQYYFKDINDYLPLSRDEEFSLWENYRKNHDIKARDKIIKSNLKFVAKVAKSYQGLGLSYPDLVAEGNIGLLKAIDKYDYSKGFKTISYSIWWIKQTILEALNERNGLQSEDLPDDYEKQAECEDDDNLSTKVNEEYIDNESDASFQAKEEKKIFELLLNCLNNREKTVIINYFGLNNIKEKTLEEIGELMGLTKERIRQIKEKALKKLRSEALNNSFISDIYK